MFFSHEVIAIRMHGKDCEITTALRDKLPVPCKSNHMKQMLTVFDNLKQGHHKEKTDFCNFLSLRWL